MKVTDERSSFKPEDNAELEDNMNETSMKASDRTRSHLLTGHQKALNGLSVEDMAVRAEQDFGNIYTKNIAADKEKGFDVESLDSIINFDVGYTPSDTAILVKLIRQEEKIGSIIIPDRSNPNAKAVIVVPGFRVYNYDAGDVIMLRSTGREPLRALSRTFKGIEFHEIDESFIAGNFISRKEWYNRTIKKNKEINNA